MDTNVPQGLDPTAFYLTKAIKKTETGDYKNPYTTPGKSGEYGAYQYTPDTWSGDAKKYLGQDVPLNQATEEQQNKVAYSKVAELLKNHTQSEVASIWNSGQPDPNKIGKGTNKFGVSYDVPGYVNKVKNNYLSYQNGTKSSQPDQSKPETNVNGYITTAKLPESTISSSGIPNTIAPLAEQKKPGFFQGLIQDVANPFLHGASSIGALYDEFTGNDKGAQDISNNGVDYGYFGKVKPLGDGYNITTGSAGDAAKGLLSATGSGIGAGISLGTLGSGVGAIRGLFSGGSALEGEVAQGVLENYAKATESAISDLSSDEKFNALIEAADKAGDAAKATQLKMAAAEALKQSLKEAGIGSFSELNPVKAKALGLTWKGIKFLLRTGADVAGLETIKGLLK